MTAAEVSDPAATDLLARAKDAAGRSAADAAVLLRDVAASSTRYRDWVAAARLLASLPVDELPPMREVRLAVLGSSTTQQLVPLLTLAAHRSSIRLLVHEAPYGTFEQEALAPSRELQAFAPDTILLAVDEADVRFELEGGGEAALEAEVARWTGLWKAASRTGARVVQQLFVTSGDDELGHLGARLPAARRRMLRALNDRLAMAAGDDVLLVDCDRLAAQVGLDRWFDPRFWHLSRQAVSLEALPLLAHDTMAVIAADLGLARKCVVVDLDNTLWGGVIGEDGLDGIVLGGTAEGEAFLAFQSHLAALARRGVVLAVCSKNDEEDARLPFERHPEMRLRLDDVAAFAASWEPKPVAVERIADELALGLDAMVFLDDNPLERETVRRALPEVEVPELEVDPALWVRQIARLGALEPARPTREDANRGAQYRARREAARARAAAPDLESFLQGLEMKARIATPDEVRIHRVAQLLGKTNQFNVTTRRHALETVRSMVDDPHTVVRALELRDRIGDHGLVAVAIAREADDVLDLDTFLMSCRVLGRTAETALLAHLQREVRARGLRALRGTYVPTPKNAPAADLFARHGFALLGDDHGTTTWEWADGRDPPADDRFIDTEDA